MTDRAKHDAMANAIRALSMDAVEKAASGHPGLPMGAADIATVLFTSVMKFDPKSPKWPDRDRFVLSAGHGSMLLYSSLYLLGYEDMTIEEIENFRQLGSKTPGHPEYWLSAGVETTTGPLGQGLGNAVGMAIAEEKLRAEFGPELIDHFTFVLAGDGCLMEGISQEAIALAGHQRLSKLIVIWDNNSITIDGPVSLSDSTDQEARFTASGWNTIAIDGHDPVAIAGALEAAKSSDRPTLIAAKTTIGFGAPHKAGTNKVHGSALGAEEVAAAREELGWPYPPFEVPTEILDDWRLAGLRSTKQRVAWEERLAAADADLRGEFERRTNAELNTAFSKSVDELKRKLADEQPKAATRVSSQNALEVINGALPETIGGSADLTGSNNTKTSQLDPFTPDDRTGRYIYFGIREHAMAAALNGMAAHGGLIPYGGSFLAFTDYCRPSIRLAALSGFPSIFVMTHDSIGLGEDGPTHQPVEHLAALRAMPGLTVYRPADATEAAECWQLAIEDRAGPSVIALSRQGLPALRKEYVADNLCALGAYTLTGDADAEAVFFASGSELQIAAAACAELAGRKIAARVVSVPSFERFAAQSEDYQAEIIGTAKARVAIEAAVEMGWRRFIGDGGRFVGMHSFGQSAPAPALYEHFGITVDAAVDAALAQL
jgi:transketolase